MPKGRGRKDSSSDAATVEEQGTVGTFETLRDEGEHFVHVQQYSKAIESFTKVLFRFASLLGEIKFLLYSTA